MASDQDVEAMHQDLAKRTKNVQTSQKKLFGENDDNSYKLNFDCLKC